MTDVNFDEQEDLQQADVLMQAMKCDVAGRYAAHQIVKLAQANVDDFDVAGGELVKYLNERKYPTWLTMMMFANVIAQEIVLPVEGVEANKITHAERMAGFMHLLSACIREFEKGDWLKKGTVN